MDYTRVTISTTTEGIEPVGAVLLELNAGGYVVQDAADFEDLLAGKNARWDYIDDDLMKLREAETNLSVYLPVGEQGDGQLRQLEKALARLQSMDSAGLWGTLTLAEQPVHEQDWAEAWKQYYHPLKVGKGLVICPSWEEYIPQGDETVLRIDPGMAFGTGTHDSTRLCLELLQDCATVEARVLDIGCGSGILAVAAVLLGAKSAVGLDIDEVAVRTSQENARRNGVEGNTAFFCRTLQETEVAAGFPYNIVFSNIVADVVIGLAQQVPPLLDREGVWIVSGIIDTREQEVVAALEQQGFQISRRKASGGWVALQMALRTCLGSGRTRQIA